MPVSYWLNRLLDISTFWPNALTLGYFYFLILLFGSFLYLNFKYSNIISINALYCLSFFYLISCSFMF
nr:MAG TPA: hypothetical protein [Caudoviricetes sp.]